MKAILCTRYGPPDVLELKEVEKPVPGEGQALIKVHAASINTADLVYRGAWLVRLPDGLSKPKDPRVGTDVAGQVEAVGPGVTRFHPGDEVFGTCPGAFAEYAVAREVRLAAKPANSTFEEAAACPVAAITALQGLRDAGKIKPGQKVLVYGASGAVGTFAVQIAKSYDTKVTAVCSTRNVDQAHRLGADHVIDYTREDFTKDRQQNDLIMAINGYHFISAYRRVLAPQGILVVVGADKKHVLPGIVQAMLLGRLYSRKDGQTLGFMGIARITQEDLEAIKNLLETRKIIPAIDRRFRLSETADAATYLEQGHASAKVIITMDENS